MDRERMIEVLKMDRDLAMFDPTTGECRPMDELNAESAEALKMAINELEQQEIIRCAECKWFQCNMRMDGYLPKGVDEFECRHWCGPCDPVDFCSHAERIKANGQN